MGEDPEAALVVEEAAEAEEAVQDRAAIVMARVRISRNQTIITLTGGRVAIREHLGGVIRLTAGFQGEAREVGCLWTLRETASDAS